MSCAFQLTSSNSSGSFLHNMPHTHMNELSHLYLEGLFVDKSLTCNGFGGSLRMSHVGQVGGPQVHKRWKMTATERQTDRHTYRPIHIHTHSNTHPLEKRRKPKKTPQTEEIWPRCLHARRGRTQLAHPGTKVTTGRGKMAGIPTGTVSK